MQPRLSFDILTLFPEEVSRAAGCGVIGKAIVAGTLALRTHQLRDWTGGSIHTLDDSPYGGGPGMVMRPEPVYAAVEAVSAGRSSLHKILLTPQGQRLDQATARRLSSKTELLLFCGRYEGVDERVIAREIDDEISIGDYVLSGGELAAMVVIDCIVRQLPGVLGDAESASQDSVVNGLLDCPHYTRPEVYEGLAVPAVLLSGNDAEIGRWRLKQALGRTWQRRPDLLRQRTLTDDERTLLEEFKQELNGG